MRDFNLRRATPSDAADLASLENMASRGLAQWFWQGAVKMRKAEDVFQWGRDRLLKGNGAFGWHNSIVAERDDVVLGSAMFYKAAREDPDPTVPELAVLSELRNQVEGSWYLDSICVYPAHRGTGIGQALMQYYLEDGSKLGFTEASLIVEDNNEPALAMYRTCGFNERNRKPYQSFGLASDTKKWLLLTATIH